jgi:zinc transporter ZupT
MDVARKLGILVFCAVPAIVGGGIVYFSFGSFTALFIYEVMLLLAAGAFISR